MCSEEGNPSASDYDEMSQDDFDRILAEIVDEIGASQLIFEVPNIYSDVAEHFNNDVLDRWREEREGGGTRFVNKTVLADLEKIIECDIDGWNDYLCELVGEPLLLDIGWTVVGGEKSTVEVRVTGYVEDEDNGD
jgi:hypothetical protein